MPMVSMQEAAKLAGVGRTTIYRKASQGLLSITDMPDGSRKVDTAELYRVFPQDTPQDAPQDAPREKTDKSMDRELIKLQVENDMLREALQKAEERESRLLDTIRLIEHKAAAPDPPAPPPPPAPVPDPDPAPVIKRPWWRLWK